MFKINNYFKLSFLILASIPVYAERLSDQDVTINSGDTQSHTNATILLESGGPYTINNAGNIISTAGSTVIVYVPTAITNSGLIDANTSTGNSVYTVWFSSGSDTSSLNNSGTIFSDHSGKYSAGVVVDRSRISSIINTETGIIQSQSSSYISNGIRIHSTSGSYVADITNAGTISASSSELRMVSLRMLNQMVLILLLIREQSQLLVGEEVQLQLLLPMG